MATKIHKKNRNPMVDVDEAIAQFGENRSREIAVIREQLDLPEPPKTWVERFWPVVSFFATVSPFFLVGGLAWILIRDSRAPDISKLVDNVAKKIDENVDKKIKMELTDSSELARLTVEEAHLRKEFGITKSELGQVRQELDSVKSANVALQKAAVDTANERAAKLDEELVAQGEKLKASRAQMNVQLPNNPSAGASTLVEIDQYVTAIQQSVIKTIAEEIPKYVKPSTLPKKRLAIFWIPSNQTTSWKCQKLIINRIHDSAMQSEVDSLLFVARNEDFEIKRPLPIAEGFNRPEYGTQNVSVFFMKAAEKMMKNPEVQSILIACTDQLPDIRATFPPGTDSIIIDADGGGIPGDSEKFTSNRNEWSQLAQRNPRSTFIHCDANGSFSSSSDSFFWLRALKVENRPKQADTSGAKK